MPKFEHGQELWLLQKPNIYRTTVANCISRCVYDDKPWSNHPHIILIRNGKLGMGMAIGDAKLFATLEELKKHLIAEKANEMNELQRRMNEIGDDIHYLQSLKDTKEDREKKLNEILN